MNICSDYHLLEGVRIGVYIVTILKILIPILLIGFGSYDFFKTILDPDNNTINQSAINFAKRVASATLIFLLPSIIVIAFSLLGNASDHILAFEDCIKNANSGYIETLKKTEQERQELLRNNNNDYSSNYNSSNYNVDYKKSGSVKTDGDFLKTAERVWADVYSRFTTYGGSYNIPPTGKTIDCSAFVSWVLYEYGYTEEFNHQHVTQTFYLTNWNEKYGWEEIKVAAGEDVTSKLQPGDILVRDPGNNKGHMNITATNNNGTILAYDCGASSNWKNSGGGPVDKTRFAKSDSRPGKIIRVTPKNKA